MPSAAGRLEFGTGESTKSSVKSASPALLLSHPGWQSRHRDHLLPLQGNLQQQWVSSPGQSQFTGSWSIMRIFSHWVRFVSVRTGACWWTLGLSEHLIEQNQLRADPPTPSDHICLRLRPLRLSSLALVAQLLRMNFLCCVTNHHALCSISGSQFFGLEVQHGLAELSAQGITRVR